MSISLSQALKAIPRGYTKEPVMFPSPTVKATWMYCDGNAVNPEWTPVPFSMAGVPSAQLKLKNIWLTWPVSEESVTGEADTIPPSSTALPVALRGALRENPNSIILRTLLMVKFAIAIPSDYKDPLEWIDKNVGYKTLLDRTSSSLLVSTALTAAGRAAIAQDNGAHPGIPRRLEPPSRLDLPLPAHYVVPLETSLIPIGVQNFEIQVSLNRFRQMTGTLEEKAIKRLLLKEIYPILDPDEVEMEIPYFSVKTIVPKEYLPEPNNIQGESAFMSWIHRNLWRLAFVLVDSRKTAFENQEIIVEQLNRIYSGRSLTLNGLLKQYFNELTDTEDALGSLFTDNPANETIDVDVQTDGVTDRIRGLIVRPFEDNVSFVVGDTDRELRVSKIGDTFIPTPV